MKKGQYFSFDAIVSAVIFVLALALLSNQWYTVNAIQSEMDDELHSEALRISDALMTPGSPLDWQNEFENALQIGVAEDYSSNSLDFDKVDEFNQTVMNPEGVDLSEYNETKNKFNIPTYEFFIRIVNTEGNGNAVGRIYNYSIGRDPFEYGSNHTSIVHRAATLEDEFVNMKVIVWRE